MFYNLIKQQFVVSIFILFALSTRAQVESDSLKIIQKNVITIYNQRAADENILSTGKNLLILTNKNIQQLPVIHMQDALNFLPGIQMQTRGMNGKQSDLIIDGSTFDQTMLLINGIKCNDIQTGHNMMSTPIPLIALSGIQVYKGAQSKRYGVGALAGAVDLRISPSDTNGIQLMSSFGTNFRKDDSIHQLYYTVGLMGNANFGNSQNRMMVSFNIDTTTGYRYNTQGGKYQLAWISEHQISPSSSVNILLGLSSNAYGAPDYYVSPYDKNSQEKVQNFLSSLVFRSQIGAWKSTTTAYLRNASDHYIFTKKNPSYYENVHLTHVLGIEQQFGKLNRWGSFGWGLEFRNEVINSSNLGQHERRYLGLFAEQGIQFTTKSKLTPSLYMAYNILNGVQAFPGLEWAHELKRDYHLFANISRGMRNPTFTDLYYHDSGNLGNDSLVAERGMTYDLGIRRMHKELYANLTGYYRQVSNFITWIDIDSSSSRRLWKPYNYEQVGTYGVSAILKWNRIPLSDRWNLGYSIAYQYNHINNNLDESKYVLSIMKHQVISGLKVFSQNEKFFFNLTFRYSEFLNRYAYWQVDSRISYRFSSSISSFLDVNNLLNTPYTQLGVIPMPGRFGRLGITCTF